MLPRRFYFFSVQVPPSQLRTSIGMRQVYPTDASKSTRLLSWLKPRFERLRFERFQCFIKWFYCNDLEGGETVPCCEGGCLGGFDLQGLALGLFNGHSADLVFPERRFEVNIAILFMIVNAENIIAGRILACSESRGSLYLHIVHPLREVTLRSCLGFFE